eukprot:Hpha_TRINITY_DN27481_c0_g1::TRINITY_DN27481_c0_g1_i1::g.193936::m.193936
MAGGVLLYARIHPECAGTGVGEGPVPVELSMGATVSDIIAELQLSGSVRGEVEVEWQGTKLSPTDLLADVGLCPESTVDAVPSLALPIRHRRVACGGHHSVALMPDGSVRCWGRNIEGQCNIPTLPCKVVEVAAGLAHTVCLLDNSEMVCWGSMR